MKSTDFQFSPQLCHDVCHDVTTSKSPNLSPCASVALSVTQGRAHFNDVLVRKCTVVQHGVWYAESARYKGAALVRDLCQSVRERKGEGEKEGRMGGREGGRDKNKKGRTDPTNYYSYPFLNQRIFYFFKDLSI